MYKDLKFLKNTTWYDVFETWKLAEGSDPIWQNFAVHEKGWSSWEEWRSYQSKLVGLPNREWKIYEVEDVHKVIPNFLIGPFQGWQQHFTEKNKHTFTDLIAQYRTWVEENVGIMSRLKHFPNHTQLIGIYIEDDDKIVLFEGHHRCAAIALAVAQGKSIIFEHKPTIALTVMSKEEKEHVLDTLLKK